MYIYILYICTIMYTGLSPILRVIYRDYINRCDVMYIRFEYIGDSHTISLARLCVCVYFSAGSW